MQGMRMLFRPLQLPWSGSMPGWMPKGGTRLAGTSAEVLVVSVVFEEEGFGLLCLL